MDLYDAAVLHFTTFPEETEKAWQCPSSHKFGFLFRFLKPDNFDGNSFPNDRRKLIGCPSQVKMSTVCTEMCATYEAWTPELTKAIAELDLPTYMGSLLLHCRAKHLPIFAEAQRIADQHLGREPRLNIC